MGALVRVHVAGQHQIALASTSHRSNCTRIVSPSM
jgi:hypothetical protein